MISINTNVADEHHNKWFYLDHTTLLLKVMVVGWLALTEVVVRAIFDPQEQG